MCNQPWRWDSERGTFYNYFESVLDADNCELLQEGGIEDE